MKGKSGQPLSVLVISPDITVQGGVSVFIETMKAHLARCIATSLYIGKTNQAENTASIFFRCICMYWELIKTLIIRRFDVIHINPTFNYKSLIRDGVILLILRVFQQKNIVVYFHGWDREAETYISNSPSISNFLAWLLNGTALIMVLAPAFKMSLETMGIDAAKIIVTTTMFDGQFLSLPRETNPFIDIVFMSRFEREKGVYELLNAFKQIATDFPAARLILAGDGAEMEGLRILVMKYKLDNRVIFTGYISAAEKWRVLLSATLFVLPTYFPEGMPVAILEAMAAGLPLITSNAGGIGEIITMPENGIVLDKINTQTVEQSLRQLLTDLDQCKIVGEHNKTYANTYFEAKIVTAQIEAHYHAIAQRA